MLSLPGLSSSTLLAQTAPSPAAPAAEDSVYVLSAFKVEANTVSAYQGKEATSAGRIRMALIDTPQSVSVITKDFMDDIGTSRLLDAMKYSAGVTESNFPSRLGRISLRGFQQDAAQQSFFVDGFRYSAISAGYNADPANLQRLEIVKGPNAIIAAAGSPGGSVNMITKSPEFTQAGYLRVQGSQYVDNRVELDVTGPVPLFGGKRVAYRLIAMNSDLKGYQENSFNKTLLVDPSLMFVFGPDSQLTIKGHYAKTDTAILNLPLDPRVAVGTGSLDLYPGLTKQWSGTSGRKPSNPGEEGRVIAEFTHRFSDNLQMRIGAITADLTSNDYHDQVSGIANQRGNIDPNTGLYTPGTTWTVRNYGLPTQTVTSVATAMPDFTNRSTGYTIAMARSQNCDRLASLQADAVYTHDFSSDVHSTTVAGISGNRHKYTANSAASLTAPLVGTIDSPDFGSSIANALSGTFLRNFIVNEVETTRQGHVSELLRLWSDRLYLSGSISYMNYGQYISPNSIFTTTIPGITPTRPPANSGYVANATYPTPPYDRIENSQTDKGYGIVYKPRKDVSLFYGHTANTNPPTLNNIGGTSTFNQWGNQWETGIKTSLLDGRLDASLTYFNIVQHNVFIYDFLSNSFISLGTTTSKGTEFELNARLTPEVSVIASAASFKARNGFGQRLRSVPDQSGALAVKYSFTAGPLKNLWLMLGADYMAERAGDIPGSINIDGASAAPGTVVGAVNGRTLNGAPVSPTFYLPARTIVALTGGYTFNQHWKLWFKIDNLTNKDYIMASLNRGTLFPGTPRSLTGSLTYRF